MSAISARRRAMLALVAAGGLLVGTGVRAVAQDSQKIDRTVSVSASGTVSAEPDRAAISTGVVTSAATAREAMAQNSVVMQKLIDGLKGLGIAPKDIQTASVNISPRYTSSRNERPAVISGYEAQNQVRILVRDLKRLGEVLDQATVLGANQMGGIHFEVSAAETLKDEARKVAMTNARRRAELYAAAAGATLGAVLSISESTQGPQPRVFAGAARAAMSDAVPVEAGSIDLATQVNVTWALK